VERSIAYAYLPPEHTEPGTEVAEEIFGRWVEGALAEEPRFDPSGARLRN
jgi:4-methylaminobutanoate oxidase (formaldehyde-forming)